MDAADSDIARPAPDAGAPETAARERVITLGCRLNSYESAVIESHLAGSDPDLVVVNTCAVTGEAVRQARQAIRKIARERPAARIAVTGCAAQIDPDAFAAMDEVDAVVGNHAKMLAETWANVEATDRATDHDARGDGPCAPPPAEKIRVDDIFSVRETASHLIDGMGGRARAYVQVQNGCDHRCTFCIIPFGRGNSRSVPAGEVVAQIRRLVETGHAEVVLTGVDITSWGADLPGRPSLGALVRRILAHAPDLARLRLSSLDAVEIDPELYRFVAEEERVAPHLHLSLQAGDDLILKRMKRRHSRQDAIDLCARLKAARPDIAFGADLIAGFPTETDDMFANSLDLIDACGLAYTHVFPFSPRPGTPAERMPQLPQAVVKERAARLRAKGGEALAAHLSKKVGTSEMVLLEKPGLGRLADFAAVRLPEGPARPGASALARLICSDGRELRGEWAS
ncbi:MAG: tRNA (N(6)-L-threonylcarbamoyladenosine(37)-C(2))-methylthiotransferase MtaB [Caulobacterales bacterium]|nr:tRNA (N(6)-L-threonylcarbamoyladenosine(37)-C(2))-methylthiotransferase MtaB [Caulobacterales bacterium]